MDERMRFEEFKDVVAEGIKDWLPGQYGDAHVILQGIMKNNNLKLTGLTILRTGNCTAPTIYLEDFYEQYREGATMQEILQAIAKTVVQHGIEEDFDPSEITDFEKCRDRIFPRLIGAEWNEELLKTRPHVLIEDLAVTFHIDLGVRKEGAMSVAVNNELMKSWNVITEELYGIAVKNLTESSDGMFISMNEVMRGIMRPDIMDECNVDGNAADQVLGTLVNPDDTMFVLTKKTKFMGQAKS